MFYFRIIMHTLKSLVKNLNHNEMQLELKHLFQYFRVWSVWIALLNKIMPEFSGFAQTLKSPWKWFKP